MNHFFRFQIPWRGVIFSQKAILKLREEFFRPSDVVERYEEIIGGLNLMKYSEFLKYVNDAGLKIKYLRLNPQLKKIPLLYWLSNFLTGLPVVRDYFCMSVYVILSL